MNLKRSDYIINFDLDDCDKILRVEKTKGKIENEFITQLVNNLGFSIEVLSDT